MAAIKTAATLSLAPLTAKWIGEVAALQQQAMASVWSTSQWQQALGERYYSYIALIDDVVCAAVVFATVLDEAELETIFVHPDFRTQGAASALLHLAFKSLPKAINKVFLEVDTSNTVAITLYERFSFKAINVRKAYYTNTPGNGDALIMLRQQ